MVKVNAFMQMEMNMMVNGTMIKEMGKEDVSMVIKMFMMENGSVTREMV